MGVNTALFEGYVGKEPKMFEGEGGSKVARLSVANTERGTDRAGDAIERTTWKEVVAFGQDAEFAEKHIHKGSHVLVQGPLQDRTYEKDGQKHTVTEIVLRPGASMLRLLDVKPKSEAQASAKTRSAIGNRPDRSARPEPV